MLAFLGFLGPLGFPSRTHGWPQMLTPQPEGRFLAPGLTSSSVAPQCLHCQGLLGLTPAPPSLSLLANLPQVNTVRKKSQLSLQRCCAHFPECRGRPGRTSERQWPAFIPEVTPSPRYPGLPGLPQGVIRICWLQAWGRQKAKAMLSLCPLHPSEDAPVEGIPPSPED